MTALWTYRRWIWDAALGDIRDRYAGSALGVFWNIITPISMLIVYSLVFSSIFVWRGAGVLNAETFPLYIASGLLTWGAFSDCVIRGSSALVDQASLIRRQALPEIVFVGRVALGSMLQMLLVLVLVVVFAVIVGQSPSLSWLGLPLIALTWVGLGFGLALCLSAVTVFIRDVGQALGIIMQIWMWSLPIVYLEEILPEAYRGALWMNPAYWFVHGIRGILFEGIPPRLYEVGLMLAWTVMTLVCGNLVLRVLRVDIRDSL